MSVYYTSNIDPIQIEGVSFGEVTITLSVTKPSISVKIPSYISNTKVTNRACIYVNSQKPVILDNIKSVSATNSAEVTLQLKTKLLNA